MSKFPLGIILFGAPSSNIPAILVLQLQKTQLHCSQYFFLRDESSSGSVSGGSLRQSPVTYKSH